MSSVDTTVSLLHLFGDATRMRLLALLADEEQTVAELTAITELPQSRVSTHLGRLREAGLLRDRRMGASTFYALNEAAMPDEARRVWHLVRADLDDAVIDADRARAEELRRARDQGNGWPDTIAGQMERHYSPGRTWEATARGLLGFLTLGEVLDLGSGDGAIAQLLASRARSITCVDKSERLIEAARRRFAGDASARCVQADMHALPFDPSSFDQVLCSNALTYSDQPERVISEAARVLRPGGTLVLITLAEHAHEAVTRAYGHVRPGFAPKALERWLKAAGFSVLSCGVTSRERKKPYFEVVTAFADKSGNGNKK
ncbi:MAG: metalloregulator ArsR/SmtB family transcription factor [Myxococcales bacterium]|nr:metalloregulator ArsR/SmtB family transcription factor [Myxococcales bacterium]MCB9578604.1 metalloregulator ArsR/SmtB family transcription factor [Polyangiaceae bacterium]